ncbi:MAG: hypothetical protein HON04_05155 [Planctomicrobium sp.]|jgi:hypothetical protein|nr:hypothetical protein [Planctomicrobium sp.]
MKFSSLTAALLFAISSAANAQGPSLPILPPNPVQVSPVPISPTPMLNQPVQKVQIQVNKIPPAVTPIPKQVQPILPPVPTPVNIQPIPSLNSNSIAPHPTVTPHDGQLAQPPSYPAVNQPTPVYQYPAHSTRSYSQPNTYSYPVQNSYVLPQQSYYESYPIDGDGINPAGAEGVYVGPAFSGGMHQRYPLYDYRRPWYTRGPASYNVDIVW